MTRRHTLFATTLAVGLAALAAGCSSSSDSKTPQGSLRVSMGATTAPAAGSVQAATTETGDALSQLKAAVITISGIEARTTDGTWVQVETGLPVDVDLVAMLNAGNSITLPADLLPEGQYNALQVRITQVRLTLMDDTKIAITPPGTGWTAQIAVDFSVVAGQSTVVNLNLRMDSSFKVLNGAFEFEPEIEL